MERTTRKLGRSIRKHKYVRQTFLMDEDEYLRGLVNSEGANNWKVKAHELYKKFGSKRRTQKQVSDRWYLHLKPGIKRGKLNFGEQLRILDLHHIWGNRFDKISGELGGRTFNMVKNYFYAKIKHMFYLLHSESERGNLNSSPISVYLNLYFLGLFINYLTNKKREGLVTASSKQGNNAGYLERKSIPKLLKKNKVTLEQCQLLLQAFSESLVITDWVLGFHIPIHTDSFLNTLHSLIAKISLKLAHGQITHDMKNSQVEVLFKLIWVDLLTEHRDHEIPNSPITLPLSEEIKTNTDRMMELLETPLIPTNKKVLAFYDQYIYIYLYIYIYIEYYWEQGHRNSNQPKNRSPAKA